MDTTIQLGSIPAGDWWTGTSAKDDFSNTIRLYHEYRDMVMSDKCLKFDTQFDAIVSLLNTYNKVFLKGSADQLVCICDLFDKAIPEKRKKRLIQIIDSIGYEKIRNAFQTLLQASENKIQEKEDLFGILKKHRLHFPEPGSGEEKLYRIGQFLNMSLINMNLLKKKSNFHLSEQLLKVKYESSVVIMPLIDEIFEAVLGEKSLRKNIPAG